jgi:hypothetical protein
VANIQAIDHVSSQAGAGPGCARRRGDGGHGSGIMYEGAFGTRELGKVALCLLLNSCHMCFNSSRHAPDI